MENQVEDQTEDGTQWATGTSHKGASFRSGPSPNTTPKEDGEAPPESQVGDMKIAVARYATKVDWPVGDDTWKETSWEVKNLGISRYRLYKATWSTYKYRLEITNTKGWVFAFYDKWDYYVLHTIRNGDHCVEYSSDSPRIVGVE